MELVAVCGSVAPIQKISERAGPQVPIQRLVDALVHSFPYKDYGPQVPIQKISGHTSPQGFPYRD